MMVAMAGAIMGAVVVAEVVEVVEVRVWVVGGGECVGEAVSGLLHIPLSILVTQALLCSLQAMVHGMGQ